MGFRTEVTIVQVHPDRWTVSATVTELVFQGPIVRYEMRLPDGSSAVAAVPARKDDLPLPGDQVEASWSDDACVLLPGSPENAPATDPDAVPANLEPTSLEEEPVQ